MENKNGKLTQFHSCFMVDVEIDRDANAVRLMDSTRMKYLYRLDEQRKASEFNRWLKTVFLAGKAQTLSVFRYHEEGEGPDIDVVIDRFVSAPEMLCETERLPDAV